MARLNWVSKVLVGLIVLLLLVVGAGAILFYSMPDAGWHLDFGSGPPARKQDGAAVQTYIEIVPPGGTRPWPANAAPPPQPSPDRAAVPAVPPNPAAGAPSSAPASPPPSATRTTGQLMIPVQGVRAADLVDTYSAARGEGRSHDAIDIIAPQGTPVLAAGDGVVLELFQSDRGGITLYQLAPDQRTIFYYAHLAGYADGVREGMTLRQGDVLGYVGDTGNSGAGNFHLHFEINLTDDPEQYWGGEPLNPYPLLRNGWPQP